MTRIFGLSAADYRRLGHVENHQGNNHRAKEFEQVHGRSVATAHGRRQVCGDGKCQGNHGKYEANYRCCLPALAGFVSTHSVGPDARKLVHGETRLKAIDRT